MYYYSKFLFEIENAEKAAAKAAAKEAAEAVAEPKQKKQKAVYKDANKHLRDEDGVPLEFIERKNYLTEYNNKMIIDAVKQVGWRRVRKTYGSNSIIDDVFLYVKPKWHHLTTTEQVMVNCVKGDDYFTTDYFTEKSLIDHLKIVVPQKRLAYLEKLSKK